MTGQVGNIYSPHKLKVLNGNIAGHNSVFYSSWIYNIRFLKLLFRYIYNILFFYQRIATESLQTVAHVRIINGAVDKMTRYQDHRYSKSWARTTYSWQIGMNCHEVKFYPYFYITRMMTSLLELWWRVRLLSRRCFFESRVHFVGLVYLG